MCRPEFNFFRRTTVIKFAEKRSASESRSLSGATSTSTMPAGENVQALSAFKWGDTAEAGLSIQSRPHQTFRSAVQIFLPVRCNHVLVLFIYSILIAETH